MDAERWRTDKRNPLTWSTSRKWRNVLVASYTSWLTVVIAPMLVPANDELEAYYGVTDRHIVALPTAMFVLAQGFGPFLLAPISELYGRKVAYIFGLLGMMAFNIGYIFAPTIAVLIVLRFLGGVAASIGPTLGASTVADNFEPETRGPPLGIYNTAVVLGPVLGPLIGSYLILSGNLRWIHYTTLILTGVGLLAVLLLQDETYAIVLQRRIMTEEIALRPLTEETKTELARINPRASEIIKHTLTRPPRLMRNPFLIAFALFYAYVYSLIYLVLVALPLLFGPEAISPKLFTYGWSMATFGLAYLGVGAGNVAATMTTTFMQNELYARQVRQHDGEQRPEYRLYLAQWGGFLLPAGFLILGWTAENHTAVAGPFVGMVLLGCGLQMAYSALQTFIIDASQPFSAAAVASTNVLRNVLGATLVIFGPDLFETLSWGRGSTLIACLCLPILPAPLMMSRFGPHLRQKFPIRP